MSNTIAVTLYPNFGSSHSSYLPLIFAGPELGDDFPTYQHALSSAELIQELGGADEHGMLLGAYQANHLEGEDGVNNQFMGDEMPTNSNSAEEEEDEQYFDPSALSLSAYHPYPSKAAMHLNIMDNFPCCRFTTALMSLIIQFAKNLGVPNILSIKSLHNIQQSLQSNYGSMATQIESMQGNIFYMNNI
ncbi:hypothetical protein B0H14DRAFT_2633164 [Mycena olivaceomarginata]|nr:hypothetical protein B0H14DRAFT_2633164 [Mycena olivaceomarginata]